jgi:hypothetical protein
MNNRNRLMIIARPILALMVALALVLVSGAAPAQAGATVYKDHYEFTVEWIDYVPCANDWAGEAVWVSGTYRVTAHTTFDNRGGWHSMYHVVSKNLQGVGLTSGDKYQGKYVYRGSFHAKKGYTDTFKDSFKLIGQGPGNNLMYSFQWHITVNANGEVTAVVENWKWVCK